MAQKGGTANARGVPRPLPDHLVFVIHRSLAIRFANRMASPSSNYWW